MSEYGQLVYKNITQPDFDDMIQPAYLNIARIDAHQRVRVSVSSIQHALNGDCIINLGGEDAKAELTALKSRIDTTLAAKFVKQIDQNLTAARCRTASDAASVTAGTLDPSRIAPVETVVSQAASVEDLGK